MAFYNTLSVFLTLYPTYSGLSSDLRQSFDMLIEGLVNINRVFPYVGTLLDIFGFYVVVLNGLILLFMLKFFLFRK